MILILDPGRPTVWSLVLAGFLASTGCASGEEPGAAAGDRTSVLRVVTYNIEDLRTAELLHPDSPRPRAAAALIQSLRPDVLVLNEIPYDHEGAPDWIDGQQPGSNAQRFSDNFLATPQAEGLEPLAMRGFMAPVNTGAASGFDLDNDGVIAASYPELPPVGQESRTEAGLVYGGDAWGFGVYPGQYGMAILVRGDLEIDRSRVRTFQHFRWSQMPEARQPRDPDTGAVWYSEEEWSELRLASKSIWDIPVMLPTGAAVHFLLSHPTPPAFDGPERRNQFRNHDEIRFWSDYLDGADYIIDDAGTRGGLGEGAPFVIVGDLNADPDEGGSLENPIQRFILDHPKVRGDFTPTAASNVVAPEGRPLDPDDTSAWGMRVDYVLPSIDFEVLGGEVVRPEPGEADLSDHFPVVLDLKLPLGVS